MDFCTRRPSRDHIIPRARWGRRPADNIVICCEPCNMDKGHLSLPKWLALLRRKGDPRVVHVAIFLAERETKT